MAAYDVFDVGAESLVSMWVERGTIVFPQSADIPVIMVGPGTGLAPFRSFIHDRISQNIPGDPPLAVLLFFGSSQVKLPLIG